TSKIQTAADLEAITTKGFRGEALAAISSVSRLELITRRPDDEFGTKVVVEGGKEHPPITIGASGGTTINITDLFFNTPARKKFLKKPATEMGHVLSTITCHALANERVHFTFIHNGRRSLDLPAVSNRPERIRQIFGHAILDEMIPVSLDTPVLSLSGFVSRPTLSRNGAQHIFFFVNDRYVKDRLLHRALMNGYRNLLPAGRFPVAFLFFDINPHEIDINVHPTKQEIKFYREDAVFSATYGAIRQVWDTREDAKQETTQIFESLKKTTPHPYPSLTKTNADGLETAKQVYSPPENQSVKSVSYPIPPPPLPDEREIEPIPPSTEHTQTKSDDPSAMPRQVESDFIRQLNRKELQSADIHASDTIQEKPNVNENGINDLAQVDKRPDELFATKSLEGAGRLVVRGQLLNSYILAEGADGLYVIDQHAAHERILFEEFFLQAANKPLVGQPLLFPMTVDFSPDDAALLEEHEGTFKRLGYDIESFGPKTFVIRAIPIALNMEAAENFIKDLLGEFRREGSADEKRERALHTLACRAAVKFGDPLSREDMEHIIRELERMPRRNVCPHGRPNILFVSDDSLRRLFKRTGFS
ncbi:MAG: DNA mismatch repair protein MutL, partial [Candidatus Omnitrophota bacterium]